MNIFHASCGAVSPNSPVTFELFASCAFASCCKSYAASVIVACISHALTCCVFVRQLGGSASCHLWLQQNQQLAPQRCQRYTASGECRTLWYMSLKGSNQAWSCLVRGQLGGPSSPSKQSLMLHLHRSQNHFVCHDADCLSSCRSSCKQASMLSVLISYQMVSNVCQCSQRMQPKA